MKQNSTRFQEVRDGVIIIIEIKSILILATIAVTTTNPNVTNLKTTDKASSGDKTKRLKDHLDTGVGSLRTH